MNVRTSKLFASYSKVSFLIQPIRDGIKGHSFLSMLRDGLIEEQLIVWVVIAWESGGATGKGEVENYIGR